MVTFPWFPHDFPMIFPRFWYSHGLSMVPPMRPAPLFRCRWKIQGMGPWSWRWPPFRASMLGDYQRRLSEGFGGNKHRACSWRKFTVFFLGTSQKLIFFSDLIGFWSCQKLKMENGEIQTELELMVDTWGGNDGNCIRAPSPVWAGTFQVQGVFFPSQL